jgi:ubiquinone/menaquinone biosynthesis C-methylase UbiE
MQRLFFFLILSTLLNASGIEDAKTYHGNSSLQWRIAIELIDSIPLMESERILDIGSGDGKVTALLAEKTSKGSVLGIDISQSMIDFASSHYPQTNYPNLAFQQRDAAELCFENQFDRVVSFSTLHWVLDQEKVLKAIYRALVPGGAVSIHTYGKSPMNVTSVGEALVHTENGRPTSLLTANNEFSLQSKNTKLSLSKRGSNKYELLDPGMIPFFPIGKPSLILQNPFSTLFVTFLKICSKPSLKRSQIQLSQLQIHQRRSLSTTGPSVCGRRGTNRPGFLVQGYSFLKTF